jgi:polysaccharide lyase-like protein
MRVTYPAPLDGGSTPMAQDRTIPDGTTEVYGRIAIRFSQCFAGHPSGVNKLLYVWSDDGDFGTPSVYLAAFAPGSKNFQPQVRTQDAQFRDLKPNTPDTSYKFPRDQWVTWEFYLKMNTPGDSNGIARWWMDGAQVAEYTNQLYSAGTAQAHWTKLQIAPYWGGTGSVLTTPQYLYWNRMRASTPYRLAQP